MRNNFWNYLRSWRKRTAETRYAAIVEKRPDGNYTCRDQSTGGEFMAAPGQVGVALSEGQVVVIAGPDGSGRSSGSGYQIIGVQTTNSRNASQAQRFTDSRSVSVESITRIVSGGVTVSSVTLTKGGAAVMVDIYGINLTSSARYEAAGITDNVAQDFHGGTTRLTIQPKASGAMAVGTYDLTVGGDTAPDFFVVIA